MNKFLTNVGDFGKKHEPEILMSVGLVGLTFSIIWGIKATINAVRLCDERRANENKEKLKAKEVVQTTWKLYLPVVLSTAISVPCIIAGNRVSNKRTAALTAAATLSQTALLEYQNKVKEVITPKQEQKIRETIAQEKVNNNKIDESKVIVVSEGDEIFLETLTGRYFKSSWNDIQQKCNKINEDALGSTTGAYTMNEWFDLLGLPNVANGDALGWSTPGYGRNGLMKIYMDTAKTPDNKPCGVIMYSIMPSTL